MAYIVTGATGHIGNNLIKELIEQKYDVVILARKIDDSIKDLRATYKIGDIFNKTFLEELITKDDIVIHLAGVIDIKNSQKEATLNINYEGTKTIIDVCLEKKVKRFVYFSTVDCIYKENDEEIFEPQAIFPEKFSDNYSHSKALATKYVMECRNKQNNVPINILYPSAVIGKNDFKPSSIGKVIQDIIKGKLQFGVKGGYNFVDVDDIVRATIKVCEKEIEGDFLLTGHNISVYELYDITNRHLGRNKKTFKIPLFIVKLFIPFIPYLSKFVLKTITENHNYNNLKMRNELCVIPVSFDETLDKTIEFFKGEGNEKNKHS